MPNLRSVLLVTEEGEPLHSMYEEAGRRGFRLCLGRWGSSFVSDDAFENLQAVALVTGRSSIQLQRTFAFVRDASRVRVQTARFEPVIAIAALAELPPLTRADFLRLGCLVFLQPTPTQLFHSIETMLTEATRRVSRGVKLVFRPALPPVIMHQGQIAELDLGARARRLLHTLSSRNQEFKASELAADMGCQQAQVKVYVERLRVDLVNAAGSIGLHMLKNDVIRNSGRGTGYRLQVDLER